MVRMAALDPMGQDHRWAKFSNQPRQVPPALVGVLDPRIGEAGILANLHPQDLSRRKGLCLPNLRGPPAPPLTPGQIQNPHPFTPIGGTSEASAGKHFGIVRMGEHSQDIESFDQFQILYSRFKTTVGARH